MTLQLHRKNYLNNIFLIRNHRRQKKWHNVLQVLKEKKKKDQCRILYSAEISLENEDV